MKIDKRNALLLTLSIVLVVVLSVIGYTYAYFAVNVNSTGDNIGGSTATIKLNLNVERLIPSQDGIKMVPLLDNALQNAISGTNGMSSCVDANGSLSCHIYKITIKNESSNTLTLKGNITLDKKTNNDLFKNLKWQLLENQTTVKAGTTATPMSSTVFEPSVELNSNATQIYYIAIWISEINSEQKTTDYGDFTGTIEFTNTDGTNRVSANFVS